MAVLAMEEYQPQSSALETTSKLRDIEEKQRLLKDRILLIGKSLVDERDKSFKDIQEIKKSLFILKEDSQKIKEAVQRISFQVNNMARKEELLILQRQFDLFRDK